MHACPVKGTFNFLKDTQTILLCGNVFDCHDVFYIDISFCNRPSVSSSSSLNVWRSSAVEELAQTSPRRDLSSPFQSASIHSTLSLLFVHVCVNHCFYVLHACICVWMSCWILVNSHIQYKRYEGEKSNRKRHLKKQDTLGGRTGSGGKEGLCLARNLPDRGKERGQAF